MQALVITTLSKMRDHHTSQLLDANLAGTHTRDYYCRTYVVMKKDKIFEDLPNVFGIPDDILVVGYDSDGKEHDDTMKSATNMQTGIPETKQR